MKKRKVIIAVTLGLGLVVIVISTIAWWQTRAPRNQFTITRPGTYRYDFDWLHSLEVTQHGNTLSVDSELLPPIGKYVYFGIPLGDARPINRRAIPITGEWHITVDPEQRMWKCWTGEATHGLEMDGNDLRMF